MLRRFQPIYRRSKAPHPAAVTAIKHAVKAAGAVQCEAMERRTLLSAGFHSHAHRVHQLAAPMAHPTLVIARHQNATPATSTAPVGMVPAQMRKAYGLDQVMFGSFAGTGAGQTIAIIDAYDSPTALSDLQHFDQTFGLPDPPSFRRVAQNGSTHYPSSDPAGRGNSWELETALDVEWSHVIAPQANLLLVEARSATDTNLIANAVNWARSQSGVVAVSMSFSGGEFSTETSWDQYFSTPSGHAGVTFVAATGDTGAPAGYPSWSPKVVAVGGTTLNVDGSGNYLSESGWSSGGGGISQFEAQPSYQNGVVTQSSTQRTTPDVSMDADLNTGVAVYDSYDFPGASWVQVGGTSLSTPMFAGLVAVADQGRATISLPSLDGFSQTLPTLYSAPPLDFHDITSGNNGFPARPGYDLVTGRGSPVANRLILDLAGLPPTFTLPSTPNTVLVTRDGQYSDITINGSLARQVPLSSASALSFTGGNSGDAFTFDFSAGDPLPTGGAGINDGAGANSLTILGGSGNDIVTASATGVSISGGTGGGIFSNVPIQLSSVQTIALPGGSGGNDTLNISGGSYNINADTPSGNPNVSVIVGPGAAATFTADQHLANLTINGGVANIVTSSPKTLSASALSITGGGKLDIGNNSLLLDDIATPLATLRSYLQQGYNLDPAAGYGDWTGASGITSSAARNSTQLTIGYIDGATANDPNIGQVVPGLATNRILVRPVLYGDLNLDGVVNVNDIGIMSGLGYYGSGTAPHGWLDGDLNYDGAVDGNDIGLIVGAGTFT